MGEAQRWQYHGTPHFRAQRDQFLFSRERREDVVRLHLGCGDKILRGYRNIDRYFNPDEYGDITNLKDYADSSVDEILCVHTFEHFFPWKVVGILKEWYRALRPGGKLSLEMPDLKKVLQHLVPGVDVLHRGAKAGAEGDKEAAQKALDEYAQIAKKDISLVLTLNALYGGENSEKIEDLHKWCWQFDSIKPVLEHVGFRNIVEKPCHYHIPIRDFRVEATK